MTKNSDPTPQRIQIAPLFPKEKLDITLMLIEFFLVNNIDKNRKLLNLPLAINRLSIGNFLQWCKKVKDIDPLPKYQKIVELVNLLHNKNLLTYTGLSQGTPPLSNSYYTILSLTTIEQKGILFLGKYIGVEIIADQITKNLAYITGENDDGDCNVGSGIVLSNNLILTCAHVINFSQYRFLLQYPQARY